MDTDRRRMSFYLPLIIAIAMTAGIFIGRIYNRNAADSRLIIVPKVNKLDNIINFIADEYVDEVPVNELIEKTIPKILADLDPHSQYIPASEFEQVNEPLEGNFSGIGIQFNMLQDTLVVIQTVANGPSQKAGILAGDRIVSVDAETVAGVSMPSDSIVSRLRGPRGSSVNVKIMRRGENDLISFNLIRDNIPLYSVDVDYMIDNEIGYIKLNKFSATTEEEFVMAIERLAGQGMKKLILDLRENGGGYMNSAVFIADQFLSGDELIVYTEGNARVKEEYRSQPGGLCTELDVEILIDEYSASASEILAGAIQDNDRGTIIGRRSFGKGLVQEQRQFSDKSAVRLTVARYYTPTGRSIQKPYSSDIDEYYSEPVSRFANGELEVADSNKFADSLRFVTPGGRIVYGGGGIMPDVFVPIDTVGVSNYFIEVRNRGLIYSFSLNYSDEHRNELSALSTPEEFVSFLKKQNVLQKFISFAASEGVKGSASDIRISQQVLEVQICAYIARNFIDNRGFYPVLREIDKAVLVAIEEFRD